MVWDIRSLTLQLDMLYDLFHGKTVNNMFMALLEICRIWVPFAVCMGNSRRYYSATGDTSYVSNCAERSLSYMVEAHNRPIGLLFAVDIVWTTLGLNNLGLLILRTHIKIWHSHWFLGLRARFTNVDQAWTKFKFDLDLGLAVIFVAPTQKLGLTLNRCGRRIKLWSSVQLALNSGPRTVIHAIFVQIGDNSEWMTWTSKSVLDCSACF